MQVSTKYNPFTQPALEQVVPLTNAQQEIWISCQLGGNAANIAYNESLRITFKGKFNEHAMVQAIRQLQQLHPSLRSVVSGNGAYLCVEQEAMVQCTVHEIAHLAIEKQAIFIDDICEQETAKPFVLTQAPLVRWHIVNQSATLHTVVVTAHHIVCDGWSLGILLQHLASIYSQILTGTVADIANVQPFPFTNYAIEQFYFTQSADYQATLQYWKNKITTDALAARFPTTYGRTQARTYASKRVDMALHSTAVETIRALAANNGTSYNTVLISIFEKWVQQQTHQNTTVVGLPVAGQAMLVNNAMIGHCVQLIPLVAKHGDESINQYIARRKSELLDDYDAAQVSFGDIVKNLHLPQTNSVPLVPVVFNIDLGLVNDVNFEALEFVVHTNKRPFETFELYVNVTGSETKPVFEWSFNTQLFSEAYIKAAHTNFENFCNWLQTHSNTSIADQYKPTWAMGTSIWAAGQLENNHVSTSFTNESVYQQWQKAVINWPQKQAIITSEGVFTYTQLQVQVQQIAHYLKALGVMPNTAVAIHLPRIAALPAAMLACWQLGAHFVVVEASLPLARKQFIVENAQCVVCVSSTQMEAISSSTLLIENLVPIPLNMVTEPDNARSLAYILYTSGSTGSPKGVQVTLQGVNNIFQSTAQLLEFTTQSTMLASSTASFDIAMVELLMPLLKGASVVLLANQELKNGEAYQKAIEQFGVTHMQGTPSTYKLLLQSGFKGANHLIAFAAGEQLPLVLSKQILAIVHKLYNLYGPTETTIYSTGYEVKRTDESITIGVPMHQTQIWICDENLQPVAHGVEGEICIGGAGVAAGYVQLPQLTQEKFVSIAVNQKAITVYRTADLGYINAHGHLVCLGRKDGQIKIRGYRVETGEVEAKLIEHPLVKDAAVHFSKQNSEDGILYGYIIANEPANIWMERSWQKQAAKNIQQHLLAHLPDYAVPQQLLFLEHFPLNSSGKIDKRQLPITHVTVSMGADATLTEKVKSIWCEVLQRDDINNDDNFFQIGGHSLAGIAIISSIKKQLGVQLLPTTIFQYPTIKELVRMMPAVQKQASQFSCLIPIQPNGNRTPLYIVHGDDLAVYTFFNLAQNVHPQQPVYGLQAYGLSGNEPLLTSFEALASAYLQEIETHNPNGPYLICGYSFGGIIAYEIVQQLLAKGKQVKLLGMFDTNAGNADHNLQGWEKWTTKLVRQPKKLQFIAKQWLQNPSQTWRVQRKVAGSRVKAWFGNTAEDVDFANEHKLTQREVDILNNQYQAYFNYTLKPIAVPIHVFRSTAKSYFVDDPKQLGWRKYTTKNVYVIDVDANHNTMFALPHAVNFAKELQTVLNGL